MASLATYPVRYKEMAAPSVSAVIKLQSAFCDCADCTDVQHQSDWVFGGTVSACSVAVPQMYGRGDTYINSDRNFGCFFF